MMPHRFDYVTRAFKWSVISKFYKSRGAQIISLIPVLGYILLWSDQLAPLLSYARSLSHMGFISPTGRLYLLYCGSLFVFIGWLLWSWQCPNDIRKFEDRETFVNRCITSSDLIYREKALLTAEKAFKEVNAGFAQGLWYYLHSLELGHARQHLQEQFDREIQRDEWTIPLIGTRIKELVERIRTGQLQGDIREDHVNLLLTLHYNVTDYSKSTARLFVASVVIIGVGIFSIPSLEVFYLVIRSILY